ncbi:MAG: hypothetical protein J6N49_03165 [Alphaproteobacteria bacterium]|nr:hypothetical protein [Alphaproteobacteria bacterium]
MVETSEIEVIVDACNLSVSICSSAALDCHAAIQFIESGRREIDNYVAENILPRLQQKADKIKKEG